MPVPITAVYASALALFVAALALFVVRQRNKYAVGIGHGDVKEVERAVRVHANAVEYVPLAVVMLALLELDGAPGPWVHAFGATLLVARVLHAIGLGRSSGRSFGRFWGTTLTIVVWIGLGIANVALVVTKL